MRKFYLRLSFAENIVCLGILYLVLVGERVGGEMLIQGRVVRGEGKCGGEEEAEEGDRYLNRKSVLHSGQIRGLLGHCVIILTMMFMLLSSAKN